MGFLSPWFLAGLAAVALPLWLHLLRQFKRTPQPFSSLMFFERRVQSSVKHRRLRYLVLLAMRLALLMLLALAFANPFVNRTSSLASRRKLTVIAVDRSFSMRYGDRMQQAKMQAQRIVDGLGGRDLVQVLALDSGVENATEPDSDHEPVKAAIAAMQPDDRTSSFGELVRALRVMDQTTGMRLDVHLISDMQRSSLPSDFHELQLSPHTSLELHKVASKDSGNWAVAGVTTSARVYDTAHTRLTASVAGWHTAAATKTVSLVLDGKTIASRQVTVPVGGRAQTEFIGFDVPYGSHRGEVRLDPHDALPGDDSYEFSVERSDPRRVLFLYGNGRAQQAFYYQAALESAADTGLLVQPAALEQASNINLSKYAFVVLHDTGDPGDKLARALCSYISKGGAALIVLGPNTAHLGKVPLSGDHFTTVGQTQSTTFVDGQHPALMGVGRFENVEFLDAARMMPKSNARILARLGDGSPLLVEEAMGEGRELIFASTLDNTANDFPLHSSFLPFVVQTARYLSGAAEMQSSVTVGAPVSLRRTRDATAAADVIGPDGKHELPLGDATKALSFDLVRNGFYEVQRADGKRLLLAVNSDRRESDLTQASPEALEIWRNTGISAGSAGYAGKPGVETVTRPWSFWRYVLALAVLAAILESVFATRYLREERQTA